MDDWSNINYLQRGSERQQGAFRALLDSDVLTVLADYDPTLMGPPALGLDGTTNLLELLCYAEDLDAMARDLDLYYQDSAGYELSRHSEAEQLVCHFIQHAYTLEISGSIQPVEHHPKHRNMSVMARLLRIAGEDSRVGIQALLQEGLTLEVAAARYFQLDGESEQALGELYEADYDELASLVASAAHARVSYALIA